MADPLTQFFEIYPDVPGATVPLAVCTGDLIYAGGLTGVDLVTGTLADGLTAQVKLALSHLQAAVEGGGAGLENIARAVAYIRRSEDRDAVYAPWDELFPDPADRPGFKVLIGDLPPGHEIRLDGLAIIGGTRTRVDIESVPARDPTVEIGDWIFTSRVHGIPPNEEVPADTAAEARQTFGNLATLLERCGGTPADLVQMTLFCNDEAYFEAAQVGYEEVFPDAATRPPLHQLISYVTPKFKFSVEMIAAKGRANPQQKFQEIFLHPDQRPIPDGARLGPLAVAPDLTGTGDGAEAQIQAACAEMAAFLTAAGGTKDNLARATFYMPDVDDRSILNKVWAGRYADEATRPPHKYAPAALADGQEVRLRVLALPGARRRTLEVPGIKHMDPMAMGALTGNLVTSSRIFGMHAFTGERAKDDAEGTALAFEHATTLLAAGGADWSHLTQVTAFIGDPAHRELVRAEWESRTSTLATSPRLNIVETRWAGVGAPRLEIVAVV